jgi:NADH:ubiquinone oxidoreductase subunit C
MNGTITQSQCSVLSAIIATSLPKLVIAASVSSGNMLNIGVYREHVLEFATYLKLSSIFNVNNPVDCYVIDTVRDRFRFTIIYSIHSFPNNYIVKIISKTNDVLPFISLQSVYPSFNWAEREAWDMSGVFFVKHPDLRRILTDYGFSGHPLRKDFPLSGFRELHYEDSTKHIEYDTLELAQNYRISNLLSP